MKKNKNNLGLTVSNTTPATTKTSIITQIIEPLTNKYSFMSMFGEKPTVKKESANTNEYSDTPTVSDLFKIVSEEVPELDSIQHKIKMERSCYGYEVLLTLNELVMMNNLEFEPNIIIMKDFNRLSFLSIITIMGVCRAHFFEPEFWKLNKSSYMTHKNSIDKFNEADAYTKYNMLKDNKDKSKYTDKFAGFLTEDELKEYLRLLVRKENSELLTLAKKQLCELTKAEKERLIDLYIDKPQTTFETLHKLLNDM